MSGGAWFISRAIGRRRSAKFYVFVSHYPPRRRLQSAPINPPGGTPQIPPQGGPTPVNRKIVRIICLGVARLLP